MKSMPYFYHEIAKALEITLHDARCKCGCDTSEVGVVLELYDATGGQERKIIIEAFRQIIKDHASLPPEVTANVIDLVSSLDISQLDEEVRRIERTAQDVVLDAVKQSLAVRSLLEKT